MLLIADPVDPQAADIMDTEQQPITNEDLMEELKEVKAELKEAFRVYDKEANGFITTDQLKTIIAEVDTKLTTEDLDGIIEEIDEDGSGEIEFDEFKALL